MLWRKILKILEGKVNVGPIDEYSEFVKKFEKYKTEPDSVPIWEFYVCSIEIYLEDGRKYSLPKEIMPLKQDVEEKLLLPMMKKGEIKGYKILKR